ncbi:hypothetical protein CEXT_82411 [Caerostris extrusa]|uniref:Cytochrome P450 n=1 Tax=Caerostris extrusa TaxID=172846 RepID=A0AAV4N5Z5_CAEEX|nr:hypothetical protein CEXT_82411 [Caerostris extrusa]
MRYRRRYTKSWTVYWELTSKGPISIGDLNELKYLDCVLKECYRLYPVAAGFGRKISEDISICGYKIHKRAHVIVAPFFLHRDEDVFPIQRNLIQNDFYRKTGRIFLIVRTFLLVRDRETALRSENPGVSHSEKLLPSLSGLEEPSASHYQNQSPIVSNPPASNFDVDNSE